jgi:hypothetical protein
MFINKILPLNITFAIALSAIQASAYAANSGVPTEHYIEPRVNSDNMYCKIYADQPWLYCGYYANSNIASGSLYLNQRLGGNIPSGSGLKIMQADGALPSCGKYNINGCDNNQEGSHSDDVADILYQPTYTWADDVYLNQGMAQDAEKYADTSMNFMRNVTDLMKTPDLATYSSSMLAKKMFPSMNSAQNSEGIWPDLLVSPSNHLTQFGRGGASAQDVRIGDYLFDKLNLLTIVPYPNAGDGWGAVTEKTNYYNALIVGSPGLYPNISSVFNYYTSSTIDNQACNNPGGHCERPAPQIVAYSNTDATSWATSSVGYGVSILKTVASHDPRKSDANDMRVMKAIVFAGAAKGGMFEFDNQGKYVKPHQWQAETNHAWDKMAGYGVFNNYRNYRILATEQVKPLWTASQVAGWDFDKLDAKSYKKTYYLVEGKEEFDSAGSCFTAALVWNRSTRIGKNNTIEAKPLEKVELTLSSLDSNKVIARSKDSANNTQYIYLPKVTPGLYKLEVSGDAASLAADGSWGSSMPYGLAWGNLDHCYDSAPMK